jgi:hypothetical protein
MVTRAATSDSGKNVITWNITDLGPWMFLSLLGYERAKKNHVFYSKIT